MPETQRLPQKLKRLAALFNTISAAENPTKLLEQLSNGVRKLTGAKLAFYYIDSTTTIVKNQRNFVKEGPLVSNQPLRDARLNREFIRANKIQNLIAVPILVSTGLSAILVLANKPGGFSELDLNLASIAASHARSILAAFDFRASETRRAHQLKFLNELVTEISLMRDPKQLLKTAVHRIQQHFSYYRVAAGWVDEATGEIDFVHVLSRGGRSVVKKDIRVPISNSISGRAVKSGSTIYLRNVKPKKNDSDDVKSIMSSPVKIGDSVIAILEIQSDKPDAFDASDRIVLQAVTTALGSGIQNANAYQNLERINSQLEEASRLKEEVLQIVAHDFRSPLTVIRGYMDQLIKKEKWLDLQQKEIMQTVSQQAFRLQKLADATLKASRFDSGDISFSFEKTDFDSFLRHLVFPWSEKHHFIVDAEKNLPLIKGDAGRLQEVMENLLSNAIKYSPEGGDITIRLQKVHKKDVAMHFETYPEQSNFLLVSVSDEGIGIPSGKSDLLFRRFARIHETKRIEGLGLGLYITKKIVEAHGGKIWLKEQKRGACFCFALPEYTSAFAENIIIVEDDTITIRLLQRAVSNLGYEVITAWDGKEALEKILRFQPCLIVTDLMLPEFSGEELIRRLHLNQECASIPIIIFTGKRDYILQPSDENSVHLVFKHEGIGALVQKIREILVKPDSDLW